MDRAWLESRLAEVFDGPVVVNRMAPSKFSIAGEYKGDTLALAERADLWIYGHAHASHDY